MKIDVSVVICAYNAENYIDHSIESALGQTGVNLEVILVDDGSTDDTLGVMREFANRDPRLKIVRNERNLGLSAARNLGTQASSGEWITPLDADDWYGEGRLARLVEAGRRHQTEMVADDQFVVSGGGKRTKTLLSKRFNGVDTFVTVEDFIRETQPSLLKTSMGYIKPLIRRDFLLENNLAYDESLPQLVDWEFWMRCLFKGARLLMVGIPGYYYLADIPGSVSKKNSPLAKVSTMLKTTERSIAIAKSQSRQEALSLLFMRKRLLLRIRAYLNVSSSLKSRRVSEALGHIFKNLDAIPQITMFAAHSAWKLLCGRALRESFTAKYERA